MKRLAFLVPISFILYCSTMQSIPRADRTQTIKADYAKTFKAAVEYLSGEGYAIKTMDSEMGLIDTDYKSDSATYTLLTGKSGRRKINLIISKVSDIETSLSINVSNETKSRFSDWQQVTMTQTQGRNLYKIHFDKIKAIAEKP